MHLAFRTLSSRVQGPTTQELVTSPGGSFEGSCSWKGSVQPLGHSGQAQEVAQKANTARGDFTWGFRSILMSFLPKLTSIWVDTS